MRPGPIGPLVLGLSLCTSVAHAAGTDHRWDFEDEASLAEIVVEATGEAARQMPAPRLHEGRFYLLESWMESSAAAAFPVAAETPTRTVEISFTLLMNTGTEGFGLLWLDTTAHGSDPTIPEVAAWEAPSMPGAFGVGFDASNPANRDPFGGSGNVYDRPQHEVSLHWDGREMMKATTPSDFRDEQPHAVTLGITFVTGGATIDLSIDGDPIHEGTSLPSMIAFAGRLAMGARNTRRAGDVLLDDLEVVLGDAVPPPTPPREVTAIDHALNDANQHRNEATVEFPRDTSPYGRIICTLRLDKPATRFDPWDRLAGIFVEDDEGSEIELIRYITPYDHGWEWRVDVSDFRPLLQGRRKIIQHCTTYGEGWVVTVRFDFHPGPAPRRAVELVPLWSGGPEIGNPDAPVEDFYVPHRIDVPDGVDGAAVRMVVTGHGMNPNSDNAAEFMPIGRTLTVNGESWHNRLWKTDNYLNPCRPQGGTWKYDRAGWAPGDVVAPWTIDVSHLLEGVGVLRINYDLDPWINANRGQTWAPTHRTEAYLILYRSSADASSSAKSGNQVE